MAIINIQIQILILYTSCSTVGPSIPDTLGIVSSVLIKGGVLILGIVLYTSLCSWDHGW